MQVSFLGTKMQVSKADMMCLLVLSRQQRQALTLAFPRSPACQVTGLSPAFPTRHSSQQIFAKKCSVRKKLTHLLCLCLLGSCCMCMLSWPAVQAPVGLGGAWKGAGRQQEGNQYESCGSPPRRQRAELAAHRRALGGGVDCRTLTGWVQWEVYGEAKLSDMAAVGESR